MQVVDLTREMGTGPVRAPAPGLCRPAAAVQQRLPGRREHPGLARACAGGPTTARPGRRWCATTRCRRCTAGSAITRAKSACNRDAARRRGQHPRGRALSRRPRGGGGLDACRSTRRRAASASSSSAPARAGSPPPTTSRGSATRSRSTRPGRWPGGMMHFGIPAYRLPRDGSDEGDPRASRRWASRSSLNHKVEDLVAETDAGRFDAVFLAIGARRRQARRHSGARRRAGARRRELAARRRARARRRSSAAASSSTAAATRRWMRRARPGGSAPTRRSSSTAATARTCRRTPSRPTRRSRRGSRSSG